MSEPDGRDKLLREDADKFVLTVAVVAERDGREPFDVAGEALGDALARLTESGALGDDGDDGG